MIVRVSSLDQDLFRLFRLHLLVDQFFALLSSFLFDLILRALLSIYDEYLSCCGSLLNSTPKLVCTVGSRDDSDFLLLHLPYEVDTILGVEVNSLLHRLW